MPRTFQKKYLFSSWVFKKFCLVLRISEKKSLAPAPMHSSIPKSCFDLVIFNKSPCCSEVFVQLCVLESTKWTPIFVSRSSHGFGILPSSWMTCAPTGTNFSFCPWPNATTLQWKRATLGIFTLPVDQILSVPPNPTLVPKRVALAKPWRVPCPSRWRQNYEEKRHEEEVRESERQILLNVSSIEGFLGFLNQYIFIHSLSVIYHCIH